MANATTQKAARIYEMITDPTKQQIKSTWSQTGVLRVDRKLITRLRSVLKRGKGRATSGDYMATPIEHIQTAVQEDTLENLETGLWFCYIKSPDDVVTTRYTLVFLFRVDGVFAGPRVTDTWIYLETELPDAFGWTVEARGLKKGTTDILAVLPHNISRTFHISDRPKTAKTPYILWVVARKIEPAQMNLEKLEELEQQQIALDRRIWGEEGDN